MSQIVVAVDSFKESLRAITVCNIITRAIRELSPFSVIELPLADGGEGTVDSCIISLNMEKKSFEVSGPHPQHCPNVTAHVGWKDKLCVIEMASVAGIELIANKLRNPLYMSTKGLGELLLKVISKGAKEIIIGIGGSLTCDGGMGMLQALGACFYTKNGELIDEDIAPHMFSDVSQINISPALATCKNANITVLCDVRNPLTGEKGSKEYSRQKIYTKLPQKSQDEIVNLLEEKLQHIEKLFEDGNVNPEQNGMGAAGGLGFGLALIGAHLCPGAKTLLELCHFSSLLANTSLVITGEGLLNETSLNGKLPFVIVKECQKKAVPVIAFCGGNHLSTQQCEELGLSGVHSIIPEITDSYENALKNAERCLYELVVTNIKKYLDRII